MRSALFFLAAAAAATTTTTTAAAAPTKLQFTTSLHGNQIQYDDSLFPKVLSRNNQLGAVGIRMDLFWDDIQPNNASTLDESKVAFYRSVYAQATVQAVDCDPAHGSGSIVILGGPPSWARQLYKKNVTAFLVAWETYLQHAISIVGTSPVLAWQLWNEMNHVPSGWINGDAFTVCRLFSLAGEAIKRSNSSSIRYVNVMADDIVQIDHMIPWEKAVSGWLTAVDASGRYLGGDDKDDDDPLLSRCDARLAIDGIGIDHYPGTWSLVRPLDYNNWSPLRTLLTRVNNESDVLWYGKVPAVMETGFSTWNKLVASEKDQARWCNESLQALYNVVRTSEEERNETYRTLSLVNFYQLADQSEVEVGERKKEVVVVADADADAAAQRERDGSAPPEEFHFGVLRSDWTKKEGFDVLAKTIRELASRD